MKDNPNPSSFPFQALKKDQQAETPDSKSLRELLETIEDKLDLLLRRQHLIFGNQVLINGRWVDIKKGIV